MVRHQLVVVVMKLLKHLFLLKIVQQLMIMNLLIPRNNKVFCFYLLGLTSTNETFLEEADARFRRIDTNIRYTLKSMLKRQHLPFVKYSEYFN